jgi:hypothetical protein
MAKASQQKQSQHNLVTQDQGCFHLQRQLSTQ